jgi:hypothetical protein
LGKKHGPWVTLNLRHVMGLALCHYNLTKVQSKVLANDSQEEEIKRDFTKWQEAFAILFKLAPYFNKQIHKVHGKVTGEAFSYTCLQGLHIGKIVVTFRQNCCCAKGGEA